MAGELSVKVTNLKGAQMKLKNLEINIPRYAKRGHNRSAEILEKKLKVNVPRWRGTLQSSIVAVPLNKTTIGIKMPFYAQFLETGTAPHPVSSKNFKLMAWWREKGRRFTTFDALRMQIEKHGTRPHPFVERSMNQAIKDIKIEMQETVKLAIKNSGFKGG